MRTTEQDIIVSNGKSYLKLTETVVNEQMIPMGEKEMDEAYNRQVLANNQFAEMQEDWEKKTGKTLKHKIKKLKEI